MFFTELILSTYLKAKNHLRTILSKFNNAAMIVPLVMVAVLVAMWLVVRIGGYTAVHIVPTHPPSCLSHHPNSESTEWLGLVINRAWGAVIGDEASRVKLEAAINSALVSLLTKKQKSTPCPSSTSPSPGGSSKKWGVHCTDASISNIGSILPILSAIHVHDNNATDNVLAFDCEVVFAQGNGASMEASGTVTMLSRATKWRVGVSDVNIRACLSVSLTAHPQVPSHTPKQQSDPAHHTTSKLKGVPVTVAVSLLSEPEVHCTLETTIGDPWTIHNLCVVPLALQWVVPMAVRKLLIKPAKKEFQVHLPHVDWAAFMVEPSESDGDSILHSSPVATSSGSTL